MKYGACQEEKRIGFFETDSPNAERSSKHQTMPEKEATTT